MTLHVKFSKITLIQFLAFTMKMKKRGFKRFFDSLRKKIFLFLQKFLITKLLLNQQDASHFAGVQGNPNCKKFNISDMLAKKKRLDWSQDVLDVVGYYDKTAIFIVSNFTKKHNHFVRFFMDIFVNFFVFHFLTFLSHNRFFHV